MAEIKKNTLKKKSNKSLGAPPKIDATLGNLDSPEVAPIAPELNVKNKVGRPKSKKTDQITTSLRPEFKKELKLLSVEIDQDMGDIIETAFNFWKKNKYDK